MYDIYLDRILLPVSPSQIQLKVKNQNKTLMLINEGEINIAKKAGLSDISFKALLPNSQYPFARYENGFKSANFHLEHLQKLKTDQIPFQFIVARAFPNGKTTVNFDEENPFVFNKYSLYSTNIKVTLEDYTINEDAKNGFDMEVDVKLKQFRPYGTKTVQIIESPPQAAAQGEPPTAIIQPERPAETAPQTKIYTIVKGDTLWAIAKKYYNNGNDYNKIFEANRDKISNPNRIYPGQVITIP